LRELGAAIAEAQDTERRRADQVAAARAAFDMAIASGAVALPLARRRARRRAALLLLGCALAAAGGGAALLARRARGGALAFTVGAAAEPGSVGSWLAAPASGELRLDFADGSTMIMQPRCHARVAAVSARGARLLIESGRVLATLTAGERERWGFDGGPLTVETSGGRLAIAWEPASERLSVSLFEGRAEVRGRCLPAPRVLAPGDSVELACAR
jgi:hypothetical protein